MRHPEPSRGATVKIVAIVQEMPDDSSYDDIVRELVFNRMVERGLGAVEAGRLISHEEIERVDRVLAKSA
jgi:predicted transcriptional regulator